MLTNFYNDLAIGKQGEDIVKNALAALTNNFTFEDVSNDRSFYYCGDIRAIDKSSGKEYFIEVKNDSRIADTGNVLCEDEVYYKSCDYYGKGNMQSNSDIYAIVSQKENRIYLIDFKVLQANYKLGEYKAIEHMQQITYCYLLPIGVIKRLGGLIDIISYDIAAAA